MQYNAWHAVTLDNCMWEQGRKVGARTALEFGELRDNLPGQSSVKAQFSHRASDLIKGVSAYIKK